MLRDAALVTLRALDLCLSKGFVLKDATAFNVLFEGTVPRLVDVHSIEPQGRRDRLGRLRAVLPQLPVPADADVLQGHRSAAARCWRASAKCRSAK